MHLAMVGNVTKPTQSYLCQITVLGFHAPIGLNWSTKMKELNAKLFVLDRTEERNETLSYITSLLYIYI